jgi:ElaB/YqjD/DUF883 family membrane-anchored ribosome-binding protein
VDSELEVIHHEMEETRASLADKLEALESQVRGNVESVTHAVEAAKETVESTISTVQETVSNVQESVKDTVHTVQHSLREAFDVQGHVQRYPWAMMGGAFAVGFLGGALLGPSRPRRSASYGSSGAGSWDTPPASSPPASSSDGWRSAASSVGSAASSAASAVGSTIGPAVSESVQEGMKLLRGLAVGGVMGLVRDMVLRSVPPNYTSEATRWVDELTTRLGGKPLETSGHQGEHHTGSGAF